MNQDAPIVGLPVQQRFPRLPLYVIGAVLALTLISVTIVRVGDLGTSYISTAAPQTERALKFEDRVDGAIAVIDARDGGLIDMIAPGSNGFLRGALRGLARERKRMGQGPEVPFMLVARADGRLTLDDPVSKRQVDLKSFGPTNARVFEQFLVKPAMPQKTAATANVIVNVGQPATAQP
jgi:putative photosynthetic complex assembly protein